MRRGVEQVHWVYPYAKLRAANVLSTLTALDFASTGKPKLFSFVSSTSALEAPGHYVRLADSIVQKGGAGLPESDNLDGAKTGITSGYGQSKWVSERLIMEAGRRGLRGGIVRPSYVVGDSGSAVTNTDDFVWRMVKGCIQLGLVPDINNAINMVPVDHVARICSLSALDASPDELRVFHVTSRPTVTFNTFLSSLARHGYGIERCEYLLWRTRLEQHVLAAQDNALFPLLHFVLDDLPTSTQSPALDDSNTRALLRNAGAVESMTVDERLMGLYLAWLVAVGFLPAPSRSGAEGTVALPTLSATSTVKAIGRSGH
jgi:L-aminoadipate-semialdehyde dehydrogenase